MASFTQLLDSADLAALLGLSITTVYTYSARNPDRLPPTIRLTSAGRPRWSLFTVERWLAEREKAEAPEHTGRVTAPPSPVRRRMVTGARTWRGQDNKVRT